MPNVRHTLRIPNLFSIWKNSDDESTGTELEDLDSSFGTAWHSIPEANLWNKEGRLHHREGLFQLEHLRVWDTFTVRGNKWHHRSEKGDLTVLGGIFNHSIRFGDAVC